MRSLDMMSRFSTHTQLWLGEGSTLALIHSLQSSAFSRPMVVVCETHHTLLLRHRLQNLFGPQALIRSSQATDEELLAAFVEHQCDTYVVVGSETTLANVHRVLTPSVQLPGGFLPTTLRAVPRYTLLRVAIDPRLTSLGDSLALLPLVCEALFNLVTSFFEESNLINEAHLVAAWDLLAEALSTEKLLTVAPAIICGAFTAALCAENRGVTAHTQLVEALSIDSWLDTYAIKGVLTLHLLHQARESQRSRYGELCAALKPIEPLEFTTELLEKAQLKSQYELLTKLFQRGTDLLQNNQVRTQLLPLFHHIQHHERQRGEQ